MRVIRTDYKHVWDHPWPGQPGQPKLSGESTMTTHVLFNRFETKLIGAVLWVRNWWFETVTCRLGRVNCRLFRRHNLTCRGRPDHSAPGGGIVDRDRWHYRPR